MPTPKSQVKIRYKKGQTEVLYESNLDASQYFIYELTRAALRDVGKFVVKVFKNNFYQHFEKHTGNAGKTTKYQVISGKSTTFPRVQIGLKPSSMDGFYAYFQELGTSRQPKLGLLTHAVQDNVTEIVKIESQYLDGLNGEVAALESMVDENEYEGDADGNE